MNTICSNMLLTSRPCPCATRRREVYILTSKSAIQQTVLLICSRLLPGVLHAPAKKIHHLLVFQCAAIMYITSTKRNPTSQLMATACENTTPSHIEQECLRTFTKSLPPSSSPPPLPLILYSTSLGQTRMRSREHWSQ